MKHLKYFGESLNTGSGFLTDHDEIRAILTEMRSADDYEIEADGTVNFPNRGVFLGRWLRDSGVTRLPFKFGRVGGHFSLNDSSKYANKIKLTTLEGCPHTCFGFEANYLYYLTNLEGGPEHVKYTYDITGCEGITSLVGGNFKCEELHCSGTSIRDFTGLREGLETIECKETPSLISTKGIPPTVGLIDFTKCENLALPEDMEKFDKDFIKSQQSEGIEFCFDGTPLDVLIKCFIPIDDPVMRSKVMFYNEALIDFLYSLDYNYVKMVGDQPCIIKWKFEEALDELGLKLPLHRDASHKPTTNLTLFDGSVYKKIAYKFVDEKGRIRTSMNWARWRAFWKTADKGEGRYPKFDYDRPPRNW